MIASPISQNFSLVVWNKKKIKKKKKITDTTSTLHITMTMATTLPTSSLNLSS